MGAKASCAMKIATGIYAAFDGAMLAQNQRSLHSGDGIVGKNVEDTIKKYWRTCQCRYAENR